MKIAKHIPLKALIAVAVGSSLLFSLPLRASSATRPVAIADLKTESQLRTEASRYDTAMRAISGISSMKLDTGDDLKKALVILNRERPNLKFFRSKFVVIGLNDTNFVNAARKRVPDKVSAEAFAKELTADPKVAFTVSGANSLKTRLAQSIAADAATLRRAGEKLKEAAAKFKKPQAHHAPTPGMTNDASVVLGGFSRATSIIETTSAPVLDPASIAVIVTAIIVYASIAYLGLKWFGPSFGIGTEADKDQVAECQQDTDDRHARCVSEARDLPSGFPLFLREAAEAGCYGDWLLRQAACLALIV